MKAIVTKAFPGVSDGEVHPRQMKEGEEISGDLARAAVAAGWAKPVNEDDAPEKPAKAKKKG